MGLETARELAGMGCTVNFMFQFSMILWSHTRPKSISSVLPCEGAQDEELVEWVVGELVAAPAIPAGSARPLRARDGRVRHQRPRLCGRGRSVPRAGTQLPSRDSPIVAGGAVYLAAAKVVSVFRLAGAA